MLLPEEPAPELGVKSAGLHFLTAGDQGMWAGPGQEGAGASGPSVPAALSLPRHATRVGGGLWAVCPRTAAAAGPWAGADPLHPGPRRRPAPQRHCRPQPAALRCSLPAAAETGARTAPAQPPARVPAPCSPSPPRVPPTPQFAGYSEEVLDVRFLGPEDSHVVVASNSPCLKVFDLQTSACQILHGHTGEGTNQAPGPHPDGVPGLASADL